MTDTALRLAGVEKRYHQGTEWIPVLRGLDLAVGRGDSLAIVGQSGSGKSTLLSLMAGLDHPDAGYIEIAGRKLGNLDERELASFRGETLGIVFQQFHLIPTLTALENVSLPLEIRGMSDYRERAQAALREVGLEHRAKHQPHQLSGGECQRIAIARAFVVQPKLLLADEPSGNLDDETGAKVMDLLFHMVERERMTMVLVTHDARLAKRCRKVLHLRHGVLENAGT